MPVIKSAIKKLKQARKHEAHNQSLKRRAKELMDAFKKAPSMKGYAVAVSALDKAAKLNVIHKNKASRLKSRLAKRLPKTKSEPKAAKTAEKSSRKSSKK